jgi:hypothetical protein
VDGATSVLAHPEEHVAVRPFGIVRRTWTLRVDGVGIGAMLVTRSKVPGAYWRTSPTCSSSTGRRTHPAGTGSTWWPYRFGLGSSARRWVVVAVVVLMGATVRSGTDAPLTAR